jgi:acyl carrier protein
MSDEITDRIKRVVAATLGLPLETVSAQTSSDTVEAWDSMSHIHLIVAIEAEFDVSFEPEQAIELTSIPAIERAVRSLRGR